MSNVICCIKLQSPLGDGPGCIDKPYKIAFKSFCATKVPQYAAAFYQVKQVY